MLAQVEFHHSAVLGSGNEGLLKRGSVHGKERVAKFLLYVRKVDLSQDFVRSAIYKVEKSECRESGVIRKAVLDSLSTLAPSSGVPSVLAIGSTPQRSKMRLMFGVMLMPAPTSPRVEAFSHTLILVNPFLANAKAAAVPPIPAPML